MRLGGPSPRWGSRGSREFARPESFRSCSRPRAFSRWIGIAEISVGVLVSSLETLLLFEPLGILVAAVMTRDQIETAIVEGIPFEIRMADGTRYKVQRPYQVAVGRTSVLVFDDRDLAHILPLLTMTGITYLKSSGKR
jgi:hypothetical protein